MNNKERIVKLIRAVVFCALLFCLVGYADRIFERKEFIRKNSAFFNEKEGVDVLFLGSSHMVDAVYPMELWNDYGITSHNFAGEGNTIALDYWILKNALVYSKPKVVVLDGSAWSTYETNIFTDKLMHRQVDVFPLNRTKMDMLNDLLDDGTDKLQFIWTFSIYHNRWNELTAEDFKNKESIVDELNRGSKMLRNVGIVKSPSMADMTDKNEKLEQNTIGSEYIHKIIEECQSEGIDILLTYLPFVADEERQLEANTMYDIASEYNLNCINFMDLDVVNYDTDMYDLGHVNASGGRKITDYLGEYITTNYDVTDHKQDTAYMSWNDDYDSYMEEKISILKEQQVLDRYLMMLADKNLSCCIYLSETMLSNCDERLKEIIANVSQYENLERLDDAITAGKSYFMIVDNGQESVFESVDGESIDIPNTTFGHIKFGAVGEDGHYLYIQDGENDYMDNTYDVAVAVINKHNSSIEDVAYFSRFAEFNYADKIN